MPKVVINTDLGGGFGLSTLAESSLTCHKLDNGYDNHSSMENRTCPALLWLLESNGAELVGGYHTKLVIVSVPDDVKWYIHDYDGCESVHEDHRVWSGGPFDGLTVSEEKARWWADWEERMRASGVEIRDDD